MKYGHIVQYVASAEWAILPTKLNEILSVLAFRAAGEKFTDEEIRARIGEPMAATPSIQAGGTRGAVAVLPLHGTIAHRMGSMSEMSGGVSTERFTKLFRQVVADDSVGAIVLDVDSPGGTVAGIEELGAEIHGARGKKPIVAVANSLMASAAYWLGAQADEVVVTPSGMVGSIGVITAHQDMSKALAEAGVTTTVISAGKYKGEGSPFAPLSDEDHAAIQARVNEAYSGFTKAVARGRGVKAEDVRDGYGEGRVVMAREALKLGMVDRIGTLDETVSRLMGRKSAGARAETDRARRLNIA